MKKFFLALLSILVFLGYLTPFVGNTYAYYNEQSISDEYYVYDEDNIYYEEHIYVNNMIESIEPYVYVTEEGNFALKDTIPFHLYKKYSLDFLEEHFENMNQEIKENNLIVHEDLTIEETNPLLKRAVHGRWTQRWWGYERNFNNSQAIDFRNRLQNNARITSAMMRITKPFPPVSKLSLLATAQLRLMASRVNANNRGRGVYVGITWAAVFNMRSL